MSFLIGNARVGAAMAYAPDKTMTAEELFALGDIGPCELIRGELIPMSPSGFTHGWIAMRVGRLLAEHVDRYQLGIATAAETGFRIHRNPDTVRAPDAAFVSQTRIQDKPTLGFFEGAPDLAVEVVSPSDRGSDVQTKAQDWLTAGCRMVWIVDPAPMSVTVYLRDGSVRQLTTNDHLDGGDVLPNFHLGISEIFQGLEK